MRTGAVPRADHVQRDRRGAGEIEDAVADERAAVDDADLHVAAIIQIGDAQDASERQRAVRGHQRIHVENFAVGSAASVEWNSVPRRGSLLDENAGDKRRGPRRRLRDARSGRAAWRERERVAVAEGGGGGGMVATGRRPAQPARSSAAKNGAISQRKRKGDAAARAVAHSPEAPLSFRDLQ